MYFTVYLNKDDDDDDDDDGDGDVGGGGWDLVCTGYLSEITQIHDYLWDWGILEPKENRKKV